MTLTRHLLPDELDLLLDGETGFGVQQLTGHLRDCASCRDELSALRVFVSDIETLPEIAPRVGFAERVMHEVHVFEPWQVAIRTSIAGWVPSSPAARIATGTAMTGAAMLVTGAAVWGWAHRDTTAFVGALVTARARDGVLAALTATARSAPPAITASLRIVISATNSATPAAPATCCTEPRMALPCE